MDVKAIVDYLKSPPFSRSESLVDFSKKSPTELLQVVNDVFAEMDAQQKRDIREEQKEQTAIRMLEFVTVLGYRIEGDIGQFGDNFTRGNPLVIYPFLHWVLENFSKLKIRAHLARYLRPFSIPEEHFADNQIVNMYQQYQTRQTEFKDLHQQLDEVRKTASNPTELQKEVQQVANEIDQLKNKLEKGHTRISNDPQYSEQMPDMLEATSKLRQEQEVQSKVEQDKHEQQMKLQRAEQVRHATARKFQEMNHSDMGRMDPSKLIQVLRSEVEKAREQLEQKDRLLADREKSLKSLSKLASNSQEYSIDDLHRLKQDHEQLSEEVDNLLQNKANNSQQTDAKVSFVRDRLNNAEKKREKLMEQLRELEAEKADAEKDLKKVQQEYKTLTGKDEEDSLLPGSGLPKPKTEAQMKEYMNELNKRTQKYKQLKAELEGERQEIQVLVRTEEILRSRDANIAEFNSEQEKRLGVVGFSSAQENLEAISAAKSQVDTNKGETLEEISEIVERINATLKKKKEKLAPQIRDLRGVRQDFEAIESIYKTKRAQYENMSLGYESERLKLEQDVQQHLTGYQEEESQYHFLNHAFHSMTLARLDQIAKEAKDGSYTQLYEKAINEQEAATKTLRNEKKNITEKHDDHVAQRSMFQALKGILKKKLDLAKNPGGSGGSQGFQQQQQQQGGYGGYGNPQQQQGGGYGGGQQSSGYGGSGSNSYLDQLAEESDRLVLEQ